MTDDELLIEVKKNIGITTDDEIINKSIKNKMLTAKLYLINGGAPAELSELAIGCISIGVNDLLNNNAGETKFSPAFDMLAKQICRG